MRCSSLVKCVKPLTTVSSVLLLSSCLFLTNGFAAPARSAAAVPGHPFSIQNKAENYKSSLSLAVTRKLNTELSSMIGGTGERVPGLAEIGRAHV